MAFASTFFPISAVGVVWKGRRVVDDARVGINEGRAGISEACAQVEWPAGWYQRRLCTGRVACGLVSARPVRVSACRVQVSAGSGHMSADLCAGISDLGAQGRRLCAASNEGGAYVE